MHSPRRVPRWSLARRATRARGTLARLRPARKVLLIALAAGLAASAVSMGTYAAFFSTQTNPGDGFKAGSVTLSDNDGGSSVLSLSGATPGSSSTGCIKIEYAGSLESTVRLDGTASGGFAPYLTLVITRGTDSSPSFSSCTNFTADSTDYLGYGPGVIYDGLLSSYPVEYTSGIVDPIPATPETWTTGESHSYKINVSLTNDFAAQGQSANATFTWEARNQ